MPLPRFLINLSHTFQVGDIEFKQIELDYLELF